jgi:hypothetical protein
MKLSERFMSLGDHELQDEIAALERERDHWTANEKAIMEEYCSLCASLLEMAGEMRSRTLRHTDIVSESIDHWADRLEALGRRR